MLGRTKLSLGILVLTTSCLALGISTPTASANPVANEHNRGNALFQENLCGIDLITSVHFIDNFHVRLNRDGFELFQSTGRADVTWFNPETGLAATNTVSGANFKDLSVVDNGDGTITVRAAITGLREHVRPPEGTVAIKDVGRVVIATVLDYNGTPSDSSDDVVLSDSVQEVAGPHPELESDFTLFCPMIVDALT